MGKKLGGDAKLFWSSIYVLFHLSLVLHDKSNDLNLTSSEDPDSRGIHTVL